MLTFINSQSAAASGNFADENFARECIQLFTVGLYHLHLNGTFVLDDSGKPRPTYDVKDVASFARAWTGEGTAFKPSLLALSTHMYLHACTGFIPADSNLRINAATYPTSGNWARSVDPMQMQPAWRDASPKMNLNDGYIGDGYPRCTDLPKRLFLRRGTVYHFIGFNFDVLASDGSGVEPFSVHDRASMLYQVLCGSPEDSECEWSGDVTVATNLPCHGGECDIDRAEYLQLTDYENGRVGYYEVIAPACTNFPFFSQGRVVKWGSPWYNEMSCSDPNAAAAAPQCCETEITDGTGSAQCEYSHERVTYQTALERCESIDRSLCYGNAYINMGRCHPYSMWRFSAWLSRPCSIKVQIQRDGRVSAVHASELYDNSAMGGWNGRTIEPETMAEVISIGSKSIFDVSWRGNAFPKADSNCSSSCVRHAETCLCDVQVNVSAVFTGAVHMPTRSEVLQRLHIGAPDPAVFDIGEYTRCTSAFCGSSDSTDVHVWTRNLRSYVRNIEGEAPNIALGKPVVASSIFGGNLPSLTVDGDLTNLFHSNNDGEQWLRVDLETPVDIGLVKVHHRTDCCGSRINGAVVLISDTEDYAVGTQCGEPVVWVNGASDLTCDGITGQFVTIYLGRADFLQVVELEVFDSYSLGGAYVWNPSDSDPTDGLFDSNTIFEVAGVHGSEYYMNKESRVFVQDYSFRNPPTFINYEHPTKREADFETGAVLDHLVGHPSTAPFVCKKLIQRLTSSNPSPRYVREVVMAFRTGMYRGRQYSGKYGDLGAAVVAIFLDREARDTTLDMDPASGKLREPLLKVLHLMRSLEFTPRNGMEFELSGMDSKLGMSAFRAPSIFNFYLPDHIPAGPASKASLYAPEAEILSTPFVIGYMNGIASLVDNGLTYCDQGFAWGSIPTYNPHLVLSQKCWNADSKRLTNEGELRYLRERSRALLHDQSNGILADLSLLLTGGQVPSAIRAHHDAVQQSQPEVLYVEGPRGVASESGCIDARLDWHGTLQEAQQRCAHDPNCGWLHHSTEDAPNIALGKPVVASSIFGGNLPSLTVDGDLTNLFHSNNDGEQWLRVDLETPVDIGLVKVHHRTDCCGSRINGAVVLI
eukprot:SAG11_NODE_999_length_6236_cov_3.256477_4_plen_1097_part_01